MIYLFFKIKLNYSSGFKTLENIQCFSSKTHIIWLPYLYFTQSISVIQIRKSVRILPHCTVVHGVSIPFFSCVCFLDILIFFILWKNSVCMSVPSFLFIRKLKYLILNTYLGKHPLMREGMFWYTRHLYQAIFMPISWHLICSYTEAILNRKMEKSFRHSSQYFYNKQLSIC